ncbi:hypothetical protein [Cysteiniphilum sp. 6C5]|uniref:hypothetical protein n=1 Tax=unclassified Cysteiniphilum TaxID=2610889 RepID=UPI003F8581A4
MMRKTIIFLSGILLAIVSVGSSLPPQQVLFNLTLDTSKMPTVEVDLSNQHLNIGQIKLDKDQKLPPFKSKELQGQVLLTNSNVLEVSITCQNQDKGHCVLHANDASGQCPACKISYQVCLSVERKSPFCKDSLNNQIIKLNQKQSNIPFSIYIQGSGGDLIPLGSNSEKFIGDFSLTFKASFI